MFYIAFTSKGHRRRAMAIDRKDLEERFEQMADAELIRRLSSGTLTQLATEVASVELRKRGLVIAERKEREGRSEASVSEPADARAPEDLVAVARMLTPTEAHILVARLVTEGIHAVVADAHFVQANLLLAPAVGGVRVLVPESQLSRAREVKAALARGDYALRDDEPRHS
jgi:hypothetical protein